MDHKEKIIVVLIFICGILVGIIASDLVVAGMLRSGKLAVVSSNAPRPIGPYSQAIHSGEFLFLSGQIGIDPVTGNISGTIDGETTQAMENLRAVLRESGLGFDDVLQARIYLTNMSDWNTVNTIYGSYFTATPPARAVVEVAGLPRGAKVEIEMVALKR